jgi:hypothetical protein
MIISTEKTYTAYSSIFQSVIFDVEKLEIIYRNEIPCLWERGKNSIIKKQNLQLFSAAERHNKYSRTTDILEV